MRGWRKTAAAVMAAVCVAATAACSSEPEDVAPEERNFPKAVGVAIGSTPLTTNAATLDGAVAGTREVISRVLPGAFFFGPDGQLIPNSDLLTTEELPGTPRQIRYTFNSKSAWSDGRPMVCDDLLLSWAAGLHTDHFNAYSPLTDIVTKLDCQAGSREATVTLKDGVDDGWRGLFPAGTILPAHIVAQHADVPDMVAALTEQQPEELDRIAHAWETIFDLDPTQQIDEQVQLSSGPYKLSSFAEHGGLLLVPNEHWWGDKPHIEQIMMWPRNANYAQLREERKLHLADLHGGEEAEWAAPAENLPAMKTVTRTGTLIDQLTISVVGTLATPEARLAFNACLDREKVAAASGSVAGVDVKPAATRLLPGDHPAFGNVKQLEQAYLHADAAAAQPLAGSTIRVAYHDSDARYAAMVKSMADSCAEHGITVVDVTKELGDKADLSALKVAPKADAFLHAINPDLVFQGIGTRQGTVHADLGPREALIEAEKALWDTVPTIPLSVQPRTFVTSDRVGNVVINTSESGLGWNMDRWTDSESE